MNIDVSNLPGNSNTEKARIRREGAKANNESASKSITVTNANVRKPPTRVRLSDILIKQDIVSVAEHVFVNTIMPRLANLAVEVVDGIARGVFLGETTEYSRSRALPSEHVSYQQYYGKQTVQARKTSNNSFRYGTRFDDVIFETFGDAQIVLDKLDDMINETGVVSIADLYSAAEGHTINPNLSCPFTGNYYGWTDISKAKVTSDGRVYWIKLPSAREIKD